MTARRSSVADGRADLRVSTRNARFQQWQALLENRSKRTRTGEFLVHGVRPITMAIRHGWTIRSLIYPAGRELSDWATNLLAEPTLRGERVAMSPELLMELAAKDDPTELLAVGVEPADRLDRISVPADLLGVVFDRPASPGNIGSVIRSADAFGAHGVIVAGHAADPYDPRSVRASTGSLFALPTVRVPAPSIVVDWVREIRAAGVPVRLVGTDETGQYELAEHDLTGPTLFVVGNETNGMSAGWREACDVVVRIPIGGAASSLNAANAATVALYEAARQRARA